MCNKASWISGGRSFCSRGERKSRGWDVVMGFAERNHKCLAGAHLDVAESSWEGPGAIRRQGNLRMEPWPTWENSMHQVTLEAAGKFLAVAEDAVVTVGRESPSTTFLLEVKESALRAIQAAFTSSRVADSKHFVSESLRHSWPACWGWRESPLHLQHSIWSGEHDSRRATYQSS